MQLMCVDIYENGVSHGEPNLEVMKFCIAETHP